MKPFPERTRDPSEIDFNKELSAARVKVECAFGLLKSRWRILGKRLDSKIGFVNKIVIACAVLHNFCIHAGDYWDEPPDNEEGSDDENDDVIGDGDDVRQILMDYIHNL